MKVIQRERLGSLSCMVVVLVVSDACSGDSSTERSLIRTDAEVFETIVRSEISLPVMPAAAGPPGFLRVDSRPVGDNTTLRTGRVRGLDLEESADSLSSASLVRLTEQRKAILNFLHVEEGGPFVYPGCGGTRTRRSNGSSAEVDRSTCPAVWRRYVTVGLPYRGAAGILDKLRGNESALADSLGETWTVLVRESSVGPGGQDWREYAWLFRREPGTNRLALAEKFLLSWAE
jgi:hypothetical protein